MQEELFASEISEINANSNVTIGKTMLVDKVSHCIGIVRHYRKYIDYVKIGGGLPFIMDSNDLRTRIHEIREMGIGVMTGGTFLETCSLKGKIEAGINLAKQVGFTHLELSEGNLGLTRRDKKIAVEIAESVGLKILIEVGRKNGDNEYTVHDAIYRIEEAKEMNPELIIIEGGDTGRDVGIYDFQGNIKWDWVEKILETNSPETFMFEAPGEKQQSDLISRIGTGVNLGNVSIMSAASLVTKRLGLAGDTIPARDQAKDFHGSPATKFVFHVIRNSITADQTNIMNITGLNRRTVQNAINELLELRLIKEVFDQRDLRRKTYTCVNR